MSVPLGMKLPRDPAKLKTHCKRGHELTGENIKWVPSKWGPQKQCRACIGVRTAAYKEQHELALAGIAAPIEPSHRQKEICKNGHAMEGDNVYIRPDGTGRGCVACRLANVKRYNARNPEEVAARKSKSYRSGRQVEFEILKQALIPLGELADDVLLSELKKVLQ